MARRKLSSPGPTPVTLICAYLVGILLLTGTAAAGQGTFRDGDRLEALMMLLAVESIKRREPQRLAQAPTDKALRQAIPLERRQNDVERGRLMGMAALPPSVDIGLP